MSLSSIATSTGSSGTITSLGIGSGVNANSIISALVAVEKAPLTALQTQATNTQAQITAFGQIQSQFSDLANAAATLADPTSWTARTGSSSNPNAAAITVTSSAPATSFTLDVDALASAQSVSSAPVGATGAAVGAGTLNIQVGSWSGSGSSATFTAGSAKAVSIAVSASDTVASIAAKINASNSGVIATAFNDGKQDRLMLQSQTTGVAGGFRVQAQDSNGNADTSGTGLSALAFDPAAGAFGMASSSAGAVQYGSDAKARINGVAVTSGTNTLANNIPGVTINLLATTTTGYGTSGQTNNSATMSVSENVQPAVANVQTFVTAYNTLMTNIHSLTAYNASTQTSSLFQGDPAIVGLQNMLNNLSGSTATGSSAYKYLSDVGISIQKDGTLAIDTAALGAAINNGNQMVNLFTASTGNAATDGFGVKFKNFAQGALGSNGLVANEAAALQANLASNTTKQNQVNDNATALQTRLQKQYTALDTQMASLTALNQYVTQQVATWNSKSS